MRVCVGIFCFFLLGIFPAFGARVLPEAAGMERGRIEEEAYAGEVLRGEKWPSGEEREKWDGENGEVLREPSEVEVEACRGCVELGEKWWEVYFGEKPKGFWLDPQGVFSREDGGVMEKNLREFLEQNQVVVRVWVFRDEMIPGEVRAEEVVERFGGEGRSELWVFVYGGVNERMRWFGNRLWYVGLVEGEGRMWRAELLQAASGRKGVEAVEVMLQRLGRKLYQKRLENGDVEVVGPDLSELSDGKVSGGEKKALLREKIEAELGKWVKYQREGMMAVGVLVLVLLWCWWRGRWQRLVLVRREVTPRLGGRSAADAGILLRFGNSRERPEEQRVQTRDYISEK